MNWVNSSLQLAGTLLESVDQHAALTLASTEADNELVGSALTAEAVDDAVATVESSVGVSQSPPISSSSAASTSNAGALLVTTTPPGSASSTTSVVEEESAGRLRKQLTRAKAELRAKENALGVVQKRVRVYEEEIEALECECRDKIAEVQQQVRMHCGDSLEDA